MWLNLARPHSTGIFDSRATADKWTCESCIESVFNQRKFVVFRRICKRGPSSWKLENLNIFGENNLQRINLPLSFYIWNTWFVFYINPLMESKNSSCLFQFLLIQFSPNSRMLSFEARMLMLSFYSPTVCISFKAKCILPQWQVKQSNLWKCISWKRKRLEIINKIDAKRASSATRESNVNTLRWSV